MVGKDTWSHGGLTPTGEEPRKVRECAPTIKSRATHLPTLSAEMDNRVQGGRTWRTEKYSLWLEIRHWSGLSNAFRGYSRFTLSFIREYFRLQGRIKH